MSNKRNFDLESFYPDGESLGTAVDKIRLDASNGLTVRYATRNAGEIKFLFTNMRTGKVIEMAYEQVKDGWEFRPDESTPIKPM